MGNGRQEDAHEFMRCFFGPFCTLFCPNAFDAIFDSQMVNETLWIVIIMLFRVKFVLFTVEYFILQNS